MSFMRDFWTDWRGVGRYQWYIMILFSISAIPWGFTNVSILFMMPTLDHWCHDSSPNFLNLTEQQQRHIMGVNTCTKPDVNFSTLTQEELEGNFSEFSRIKCEKFVYDHYYFDWTITEKFDLVCDRDWMRSATMTVYMFGYLISAFGSGALADRFGRRPMVLILGLFGALMNFLCGLAPWIELVMLLRFLSAVCDMGISIGAYIIVMEIVEKKHRKLPNIIGNCCGSITLSLFGVLTMYIRNFEHLAFFVGGLYTFSFLIDILWYPESPRWLAIQNQSKKLEEMKTKMTKINGNEKVFTRLNLQTRDHENATVWDLFRTPTLRKRTIINCVMWFTLVLVYYALIFSLQDFGSDLRVSFALSYLLDLPSTFIISFTLDRMGRQVSSFIYILISGLCCLAMAPIINSKTWVLTALALSGRMFASMQFSIVYIHTPEMYPTALRSTGLGISSTVARIAGMLAPQIALLNKLWPPFTVVILGICGLINACLMPLLPDTTGLELAQTVEEGEKFCGDHTYKLVLPSTTRRNKNGDGQLNSGEP